LGIFQKTLDPESSKIYVRTLAFFLFPNCVVYKFGKIESVNVRSKGKDTFAFITFYDDRDARDAMSRRDGYQFDKYHRMRVEVSKGSRRDDRDRDNDRGYGRDSYERRDRGDRRDYADKYDDRRSNRRERPTPKINEKYVKVVVENMPEGCSWQDLKDFIKKDHPSVKFTEVNGGKGTAGFETKEEAEKVVEALNNSSMKNRDGAESTVTMTIVMPDLIEESNGAPEGREDDRKDMDIRDDRRSRSRSHSRD
jgi:RNA recognition motif-containing protein